MPPTTMPRIDWELRIARARELAAEFPAAIQLLKFYVEVAGFQRGVYERIAHSGADLERSLRAQIDVVPLLGALPELLQLVEKQGPPQLADSARSLRSGGEGKWRELLAETIAGQASDSEPETFFARACVEPYAEHLAAQITAVPPQTVSSCPACAGKPMLAVLRPEGEGARRSLMCSFCLTEWDFRRLLCPSCGQDKEQNLPVYTSESLHYVRVESCDTCRQYLLAIDLSKNGHAVPLVDQLAAAPLDLWSAEKGYSKIATHLLGL